MIFILGFMLVFGVLLVVLLGYICYFWDSGGFMGGGPRNWVSSFECGFVSFRLSENYFSCAFFLLLVLFVIFDLEVSLLLNVSCEGLLFKNYDSYLIFTACLALGYLFEVEGGYASWGV